MQQIYYKITNKDENHNGFQYKDGLNVLLEPFNDDLTDTCCPGGFYFTSAEYILKFLSYGIYLREVTLPTNDKNFKMVADDEKYRSNMIILGKRYDLSDTNIIKYLVTMGAGLNIYDGSVLAECARMGYVGNVKSLFECGVTINYRHVAALTSSAENGHLDVVKYLVKKC